MSKRQRGQKIGQSAVALAIAGLLILVALRSCGSSSAETSSGRSEERSATDDEPRSTTTTAATSTTTTTAGTTTAPSVTRPPPGTRPPGTTIPPPATGGESTATGLTDTPSCDPATPTRGVVTLSWTPGAGDGEQQVTFTTRKNGFETGAITSSGTLEATTTSWIVHDPQPGGVYYWRVLTRRGNGWAASTVHEFTGPTCIVDRPG